MDLSMKTKTHIVPNAHVTALVPRTMDSIGCHSVKINGFENMGFVSRMRLVRRKKYFTSRLFNRCKRLEINFETPAHLYSLVTYVFLVFIQNVFIAVYVERVSDVNEMLRICIFLCK